MYHVTASSETLTVVRTSFSESAARKVLLPSRFPNTPSSRCAPNATSPSSRVSQSSHSSFPSVTRISCAAAVACARFSK